MLPRRSVLSVLLIVVLFVLGSEAFPFTTAAAEYSVVCTGGYHACAIRDDRSTVCWGSNDDGQLGLDHDYDDYIGQPDYADGPSELGDALVALDLGTDGDGNDLTAKSLSCGVAHTCAVLSDDTLKCWGNNGDGQLGLDHDYDIGDGDYDYESYEMGDDLPAVSLGTDSDGNALTAKSVSCGYEHTCAVLSDDTLKCWGNNDDGQLGLDHDYDIGDGDGDYESYEMGDDLPAVSLGTDSDGNALTAKSVSCGYEHTCAVLSDDTLKCWGNNGDGQLGLDHDYDIGDYDYGVGDYESYEMGDDLPAVSLGTDSDGNDLTAKSVSCGYGHTCAVLSDDTLKCWGNNGDGQLGLDHDYDIGDGDGDYESYEMGDDLPAVSLGTDSDGNDLTAKSVSCGYEHTCAVLSDDTLKCWGSDVEGNLGEKTTFDENDYRSDYKFGTEPGDMAALGIVNLGTNRTVLNVFLNPDSYSSCALLDDNSLKCWGGNAGSGKLGNEVAAYTYDYIGDGMKIDEDGNQVVLDEDETEMGDSLIAVNLGTGRTVFKLICLANEYVASNGCTACAAGTTNAAGDDASGADTTCDDATLCAVNEYVASNVCTACAAGTTNAAGDDASGADTTCDDATLCAANQYVASNVCTACAAGTTNAAGDDASGADTTCDDATLCAANQYVASNVCTACAAGTTNAAGDDASGADTTCDDATLCAANQYVASNVCTACAAGTTNAAGDDASGADTTCDDATLCAANQYVASNVCTACAAGTTNAAGDDASGADTTCDDATLCAVNEYVASNVCTACAAGTTNAAGDDASGADTTCDDATLCAANQYVASNVCTACAAGTTNAAGDDASGADTTCTATLCAANQYVASNVCTACAAGTTNAAGDDASGADTTCTATLCAANQYVASNVCTACAAGTTNAAGDDASGADTTCDDATLCAANQYVASNVCTACAAGTTNAAGDDASGADTTCDDATLCAANQYVASNVCTACAAGTTNAAGDDASGADTTCTATLCAANQYVASNVCTACAAGTTNAAGDDASGSVTTCAEPGSVDAESAASSVAAVSAIATAALAAAACVLA